MDITPQDNTTQPISDDQDLAKALAGVLPDEPEEAKPELPQFEEIIVPPTPAPVVLPGVEPVAQAAVAADPAPAFSMPAPSLPPASIPSGSSELEDIKKSALVELRPLIDRVDLPVEEKFDTYLMLIRSTDDASLIAPAHAVAQTITDEKRKAEALLEIIKEIDYLSRKTSPEA